MHRDAYAFEIDVDEEGWFLLTKGVRSSGDSVMSE